MHTKTVIKADYLAAIVVIMFFSLDAFSMLFRKIIPLDTSYMWIVISFFLYSLSLIYITIKRKIRVDFFIVFSLVFLYMVMTYIIHPEYEYWLFEFRFSALETVFKPTTGIFAIFIIQLLDDKKLLFQSLKASAWISFFYNLNRYFNALEHGYWATIGNYGQAIKSNYSLSFGYSLYFILLIFFADFIINRKRMYIIPIIVASILLISAGSRGPILLLILSVFLLVFFTYDVFKKKKNLIIFVGLFIFLIILYHFDILSSLAFLILDFIGISSRTVSMLLQDEIISDNGRLNIYQMSLNWLLKNPLLGQGFYGDRIVISPYYIWGYSHNIFIEILVDFGFIIGGLLCVLFIVKPIHFIYKCQDKYLKLLCLIFYTSSFRLLLSFSFWQDIYFWALIGLLLKYNTKFNRGNKKSFKISNKLIKHFGYNQKKIM